MYWNNVTPKDNKTPSSVPVNGIYQYEQHMKGIDPKQSPPEVRSNIYHIEEPVWDEPSDCECTTRFCKGQVNGLISPQTVLVNGTPHQVKDLHRCNESAIMEEDKSNTSSSSEMGVMVTCESEGQHSPAQSTSEEDTENENDQTSGDRGNAGNLIEEHLTLPQRSTQQKRAPPPCHICDYEIRGECSENWDENSPSLQRKHQHICSVCKIYFLNWKNMTAPSKLILQMVTHLHADSHIKLQSEDAYANEGRQKRT